MDTTEPTRINCRPAGPIATAAADARGGGPPASLLPSSPWATTWTHTYSRAIVPIAPKIARGTVRDGFTTSPLGTRALSIPRKAKRRRIDARATELLVGVTVQCR